MYAEDAYRELCTRSHRLLGLYLSIWTWVHRLDCVVVDGKDLRDFFDVVNVRKERMKWLEKDVEVYFRHMESLFFGGSGTYASLYLSRKKFPEGIFAVAMKDDKRIETMKSRKFRAAKVALPSEKEMFEKIHTLAAGLEPFPVDPKAFYKNN